MKILELTVTETRFDQGYVYVAEGTTDTSCGLTLDTQWWNPKKLTYSEILRCIAIGFISGVNNERKPGDSCNN